MTFNQLSEMLPKAPPPLSEEEAKKKGWWQFWRWLYVAEEQTRRYINIAPVS